jgi:phosphatidylserine/phosphatidylglycerophosphate/cardiolipin synthase-like enzyme
MQEIATALRSGRLAPPFTVVALQRVLPDPLSPALTTSLMHLSAEGFTAGQIATILELLRSDRLQRPRVDEVVQLVTTGPEVVGSDHRDTSVVVRDLFASATRSVLVAGYAVYQGQRVFQALADRMRELPELQVHLFLDIQRGYADTTLSAELIKRFAERFVRKQWPANRPLPNVFYDPRSLEPDQSQRASLHAKCVVVDDCEVFVSSANFTEAAQQRNIELGLLLRSESTAATIKTFFEIRVQNHLLLPLNLP